MAEYNGLCVEEAGHLGQGMLSVLTLNLPKFSEIAYLYTLIPQSLHIEAKTKHYADNLFKCMSLNKNMWISINVSLKCVPKCQINNILSLVLVMIWRPDKATSDYLKQWGQVQFTDAYMHPSKHALTGPGSGPVKACLQGSLCVNELNCLHTRH